MQSSNERQSAKSAVNGSWWQIPHELGLSLATGAMLAGILTTKGLMEGLQAIGKASEEVFRGDRLPVLNFPNSEPKDAP